MPRLPKWIKQTVKDRTLPGAKPLPRGRPAPPLPSEEEFVSPLKQELNDIYVTKRRVCNYHCTGCTYTTGTGCALDKRAFEAVNTKDDPQPYLADLRQELVATRDENAMLREELRVTRLELSPNRRFITLLQYGVVALLAKAGVDAFMIYVLPLLIP